MHRLTMSENKKVSTTLKAGQKTYFYIERMNMIITLLGIHRVVLVSLYT